MPIGKLHGHLKIYVLSALGVIALSLFVIALFVVVSLFRAPAGTAMPPMDLSMPPIERVVPDEFIQGTVISVEGRTITVDSAGVIKAVTVAEGAAITLYHSGKDNPITLEQIPLQSPAQIKLKAGSSDEAVSVSLIRIRD